MAWTTPRTWTNVVVSASDLNTDIRDNENILKTRIADNGNPLFASAGGAAKTTTYTVTTADVLVDCGGSSPWQLDLYAVSGNAGRILFLRNTGTTTVTVDGNASETIDGATSVPLLPRHSMTLWCNGSAWFTLGQNRRVLQESFVEFTTGQEGTDTTYADVTGHSLSFTPISSSSTIYVVLHCKSSAEGSGSYGMAIRVVYGGTPTQVFEDANCLGNTNQYGSFASPGAGSAITIKLQAKMHGAGATFWHVTEDTNDNVHKGFMQVYEVI